MARVSDVGVEVEDAQGVDYPDVDELVTATPVDDAGRETTPPSAVFSQIMLHNDNARDLAVRAVVIIWDTPLPDRSQQALRTVELPLTTVPTQGDKTISLRSSELRLVRQHAPTHAMSVKAYFSR